MFALIITTALDYARAGILWRLATWFARRTGIKAIEAGVRKSIATGTQNAQSLRDIIEIRNFIQGENIITGFELLWSPIFFLVLFIIHPLIGAIGVAAAVVMVFLGYLTEVVSRKSLSEAGAKQLTATAEIGNSLRNAEAVDAMGMGDRITGRWQSKDDEAHAISEVGNSRLALINALSRNFLLYVKICVVTVSVVLVLNEALSPGAIFASFIIVALMLRPFNKVIGSYRQTVLVRDAWARLRQDLTVADRDARLISPLPTPVGPVTVDSLVYVPPGMTQPVIRGISFAMHPGEVIGGVGPSGAGKSTLARLLIGVVRPTTGSVRIDGTSVYQWERRSFGAFSGYLPQSVSLFDGTVRENICRFEDASMEELIEAAKRADVHEMIGHLPFGYDTRIGDQGYVLTGGQRQRIALARAMFGKMRYVVLDEPDAHLDQDAQVALMRSVRAAADTGATVVVVTHRPSILEAADKILIMKDGRIDQFGWRDNVLESMGLLPNRPKEIMRVHSAGAPDGE